ncbi:uncharacterized protein DUF2695 [Brevibacterium sanguinis]|uniref:Uncharacterized protein DUF2695 n=2 Tax=Brevibacterium TaxID=1696 RepID=A0A366IKC6_9MICO|nr:MULTISPECIES: DUF2695 domain-containing protein [Brevibacterium]RBP66211.1 uncharacterized protein DUF2695 [Brevibacterium sanguinis]RBP72862.1 uncharacterized protein DUF2695 [Brevibacterium celere]
MDRKLIESEAMAIVEEAASRIMTPYEGECLLCYTYRQLTEFGCDGTHRFALSFRDRTAPRATALLRNLARVGACCCDCEIFRNAYHLGPRPLVLHFQRSAETDETGEPPAEPFLWCQGVRRGSTQACGNWVRMGT